MKDNLKKGFTLIELVVVMVIISILSLIAIPSISKYVAEAEVTSNKASLKQIHAAAQIVYNTEKEVNVYEDYPAFMDLVADMANIKRSDIGKYTYQASSNTIYIYLPKSNSFLNYNGVEFGYEGIPEEPKAPAE